MQRRHSLIFLLLGLGHPARAHREPGDTADSAAQALPHAEQRANHEVRGWPLDDFTLTDHNAQAFTPERLRGRWTFVLLGDTSRCATACGEALATLAGLCQRIARTEAIKTTQVLFISRDAQHDTPQRLGAFLAPFNPRFIGATGSEATLASLAGDLAGGSAAAPRNSLVLIGPDAMLRVEYLPPFDVQMLTADYLKTRLRK